MASAKDQPNVVLIVLDDYGYSDTTCYGSTFYRTPNIDQLAKEGMRFTHGYASCPVCSPTRAAIMTGRNPARLHLTDWLPGRGDLPDQMLARPKINQFLPPEEITIAELLQKEGYATCSIGKWHLGGDGHGPTTQGFDINVAGSGAGHPPTYFAPYGQGNRSIPDLEKAPKGEYLTDRLAEEAVKFIEAHKAKPFFLYLPHYAVHPRTRGEIVGDAQGSGRINRFTPAHAGKSVSPFQTRKDRAVHPRTRGEIRTPDC